MEARGSDEKKHVPWLGVQPWGDTLPEWRCWGLDDRPVTQDSPRKSLSIENTFAGNLRDIRALEREMETMLDELEEDLRTRHSERHVRSVVVKMKFADFRRTTAERAHSETDRKILKALLVEVDSRSEGKPAQLLRGRAIS